MWFSVNGAQFFKPDDPRPSAMVPPDADRCDRCKTPLQHVLKVNTQKNIHACTATNPFGIAREGICGCTGMDIFVCVDFQHMLKWRFTSVTSICIRWHHRRGAGVIVFEKLCPVDRKPRYSCAERCKPSAPVPTYGMLTATYTYSILPDAS